MAKVKKIKKAQDGALCKWSSKKGGGVSCGRRGAPKQDTWKSPRIKFGKDKDNEPVVTGRGIQEKPFERDFPGDKAPAGFDQRATGKKGTRWTTDKGKMKYAGQSFKNGGKKVVKKAKHGKKVVNKSKKK
jgi:hypothetical protein